MSSPPRFFGEDSKWLPRSIWGHLRRMCMAEVWVRLLPQVCALPVRTHAIPVSHGARPAPAPYLGHTSSLTYLFLQGRD